MSLKKNSSARKRPQVTIINPVIPKVVTELELIGIETQRLQVSQLRKQATAQEAALEQAEAGVIAKLKAGAVIEDGSRTALITAGVGPCRPKWRELHVEHMLKEHGQTDAVTEEQAKKAFPAKPTETLVISIKIHPVVTE